MTKDEYEQAQEAIQRRRKLVRSSHDQSDRVYFCAHCGGKLEKANGTVFACPSHRYHDGSPCENVRWRKSALEEIVFEALKRQIEIVSVESAAVRKAAKSKGESLERQLVLLKAQYDACDREKFTIYENYREGKLTPEEYLSGKDALAQKQAALKEQLESCETQLEVFHQQSLDAEERHEAASRMTNLESICMMQLNVYLFMTLRQSRLSGSSTNQKSTPMKTSELRIDSGVSFRGKSVEFAPKIT